MRQRVAFLRTLLAGKPVLGLDEPFGVARRDHARRDAGAGWPTRCAREPRTVLLVTHDVEEAACSPTASSSCRPARAASSPSSPSTSPRPRDATDPALVALREQALEALR